MMTRDEGVRNLYHNTWDSANWMMALPQADGQGGRTGDEVFLQSLVVKMHFNSKPDRQSMTIRALLVKVPSHLSNTTANTLFLGSDNKILVFPDQRDMKVLAQKVVRLQGDTVWNSSDTVQKDLSATMNLKANFYNSRTRYDAANEPMDFQIRLLVVAYDSHGTLTTDNIADYMVTTRLYFKDP